MELRYVYQDSETGENDTADLTIDATEFDESVGPAIVAAFYKHMAQYCGDEPVESKLEHFSVFRDRAVLTFRETVVPPRGRISYDVLITGIVYSTFVR